MSDYYNAFTIDHKTTSDAIERATLKELRAAMKAVGYDGRGGRKAELVNVAKGLRNKARAEHEVLKAEAARAHEEKIATEKLNSDYVNIRRDMSNGLNYVLVQARESYDKLLDEMRECDNVAHWVKWNLEKSLKAEAWWVAVKPLAAYALEQRDEPTQLMTEMAETLEGWFKETMDRLLDCDPNAMGMSGNGAASLAEFNAKQRLCRVMRYLIRELRKELSTGYEGRCKYLNVN